MQVFISHAEKDRGLARQLTARLSEAGIAVWNPESEIFPGDNWPKMVGEALSRCELMVVLLTPGAVSSSPALQHQVTYALSSLNYEHRVVTLFVGPTLELGTDLPWILARLPYEQVDTLDDGLDWLLSQLRTLVG